MTKTLYFQSDTSGKLLFHAPLESADQPHMLRLAWVVTDGADEYRQWGALIQPKNDWRFEPDAIVANGIDPEVARQRGHSLSFVMGRFLVALSTVERACAFNADFHRRVVMRSLFEMGNQDWANVFDGVELACAMREATDVVRKPSMKPGSTSTDYAWPKMWEAYDFFVGEDLPSLDLDPIERGVALARCVAQIDRGIQRSLRSMAHE